MQRTTSFEPILWNLCVEETRSYYREECEKCGFVTCNDCLSEDVLIVFNKRWCYECYDNWFNRLSLLEREELLNKFIYLGLMNSCEICGTCIQSSYVVCSSFSCIMEYQRELNRIENNKSPRSVIEINN